MIMIGPEDIGKKVFVRSVGVIGTMTCFTSEFVWVLSPGERKSRRFKPVEVDYVLSEIRH